jgi:hypothetical protein
LGPAKAKSKYQYAPETLPANEKMKLQLDWHYTSQEVKLLWQDEENSSLEDQLEDIVVGLLVAGEWAHRNLLQRSYEHRLERQRELKEQIRRNNANAARKERRRLQRLEAERREKLIAEALAWRRASDIRAYVHARLERSKAITEDSVPSVVETWMAWALSEADRIDPLLREIQAGTS